MHHPTFQPLTLPPTCLHPNLHSLPPLPPSTNHHTLLKQVLSHPDANIAIHKAINQRIHLLPNMAAQSAKLGKSPTSPPCKGLMWPSGPAKNHPAAPLLDKFSSSGCLFDCGKNWKPHQLLDSIKYWAHLFAKNPEALQCLVDKTNEKVQNRFARVVQWGDIKNNLPPKLKLRHDTT